MNLPTYSSLFTQKKKKHIVHWYENPKYLVCIGLLTSAIGLQSVFTISTLLLHFAIHFLSHFNLKKKF